MDEYIHLTFYADHPMLHVAQSEGRIPNPKWLEIDSDLLMDESVRFCAGVANKKGAKILTAADAVKQIDFDALFGHIDGTPSEVWARRNEARKSEILIPEFIPLDHITIR